MKWKNLNSCRYLLYKSSGKIRSSISFSQIESILRNRLNIRDVLTDAGYTLHKRDGLRYPAYVRLDNDGRRIRGDKFIVMPNKNCCFQPPTIKLYSVTSFIWEHPNLFPEYNQGMKESALVHKVCQRLLNIPVEQRNQNVLAPTRDAKPFNIKDYKIERFHPDEADSQKPFYEGRSSTGRLGLFIHVTAGFGDVGFAGYWTLEIFCVQPIRIYPNVEICQIYYHDIHGEYEPYKSGKYQNNMGIQPSLLYKDFEK